ncbi:MAG TPA: hypothetical protein VF532_01030, partial [Candidatus Angelobacter sp.]
MPVFFADETVELELVSGVRAKETATKEITARKEQRVLRRSVIRSLKLPYYIKTTAFIRPARAGLANYLQTMRTRGQEFARVRRALRAARSIHNNPENYGSF